MIQRRIALTGWAVATALAVVIGSSYAVGVRFNTTVSAPRGFWRINRIDPATVRVGEMVSVCPPAEAVVIYMRKHDFIGPGNCLGTGSEPFLKPVVAVAGDIVTVLHNGPVEVNGVALPNSKPLAHMPAWPAGTYKVKRGEVWLISSYDPGSFDSRYFGPVSSMNIRGQAVPLLIRGPAEALTPHVILQRQEGKGR